MIYTKICETLLNKAEEIIPRKKIYVCMYTQWNEKVGEISRAVKQAKRRFNKRNDLRNCQEYCRLMDEFREAEKEAREKYLEDLVELLDPLDPRYPNKFLNIINKGRKDVSKSVVQPIKQQDRSYVMECGNSK